MVYFVQSGNAGPIKIGYASTMALLTSRLLGLQSSNPEPIQCLGFMEGARQDEYRTQASFSQYHIHGEWFRANDTLLSYITEHSTPYTAPRMQWEVKDRKRPRINKLAKT